MACVLYSHNYFLSQLRNAIEVMETWDVCSSSVMVIQKVEKDEVSILYPPSARNTQIMFDVCFYEMFNLKHLGF